MIADQIAFLKRLYQVLFSELDARTSFNRALDQILEYFNVDAGAILVKYPKHSLNCIAISGFDPIFDGESATILELAFDSERSWGGNNGKSGMVVGPDNFTALPVYDQLMAQHNLKDFRVIYLPAINEIKGVLGLFGPRKMPIKNGQHEFLELVGYQLGAALQVKELSELIRNQSNIEDSAYDKTVWALVNILDMRDSETEEHTLRVANLAVRLAQKFGFSKLDMLRVRRGALLHDIGKIAISDKILRKPAPLNKQEWEIMRQHPEIALELLSQFPFMQDAMDIPIAHHERWDGSGYPRGLAREDIPLIARIFAVVDVWDALCSDRPYRRAWPESDVLAYILSESGRHFDPDVVEAFMEVIESQPRNMLLPEFELLT